MIDFTSSRLSVISVLKAGPNRTRITQRLKVAKNSHVLNQTPVAPDAQYSTGILFCEEKYCRSNVVDQKKWVTMSRQGGAETLIRVSGEDQSCDRVRTSFRVKRATALLSLHATLPEGG